MQEFTTLPISTAPLHPKIANFFLNLPHERPITTERLMRRPPAPCIIITKIIIPTPPQSATAATTSATVIILRPEPLIPPLTIRRRRQLPVQKWAWISRALPFFPMKTNLLLLTVIQVIAWWRRSDPIKNPSSPVHIHEKSHLINTVIKGKAKSVIGFWGNYVRAGLWSWKFDFFLWWLSSGVDPEEDEWIMRRSERRIRVLNRILWTLIGLSSRF